MKEETKNIYLSRAQRQKVREHFNVAEVTLSEALHFKKHSRLCREIRLFAVNYCRGVIL